jgi:hypothetical protein
MDKDIVDIYYDHYKETYSLHKEAQQRRNKNFVVLCVLEAVSFLLLIRPDTAIAVINLGINSQLDTSFSFGIGVVQTFVWILIAYILVRYCQDVMYVERQYMYIDRLEKRISNEMGENLFSREGENYVKDYPMILNFIDLFYKMFSPILFAGINIAHINMEWQQDRFAGLPRTVDTILFVAIMIITWFYFFEMHSKITGWFKKYIPPIRWIANVLRKILKEV